MRASPTIPLFSSFAARDRHRDELLAILGDRFAAATTETWLALLRGVVPIAAVRSLEQALDSAELSDRDMLVEYEHPVLGTVRSVGLPMSVGEYRPAHVRGPRLGEHEAALLEGLGYSKSAIAELRGRGAFGESG